MPSTEAQLMAVSPLDGRYAARLGALPEIASELALIKTRVEVMAGWVGLLGSGVLPDREPLSDRAQDYLLSLAGGVSTDDAMEVKTIEDNINHDVKAVEVWLTSRLDGPDFDEYRTMVHFGRTSEDVNSAAYGLMTNRIRDRVVVPKLNDIGLALEDSSLEWADIPMLALTHGQPATPTTLGKEMLVFAERVFIQAEYIDKVQGRAKFSGASGGYNADRFAYPEVNWPDVARNFVTTKLGLEYAGITGQIEPHDGIARFANETALANRILFDVAKDMWLYISRGVLKQRLKAGEVGSSTMPHKVNPIDFENAEGSFDMANGLLQRLADSLPVSRMQRDLSDSTRLRSLGAAFGYSVVGYGSMIKGLGKVSANETKLNEELNANWPILTEAVQTIMRRYNVPDAYTRIKDASRGHELDAEAYATLVQSLVGEMPEDAISRLMQLTPASYLGYSAEIAKREVG